MSVIIILITASLLVATGFLISFFWAVKSGQYEDDYTPSVRILFDNEIPKADAVIKNESNNKSETLNSKH